MKGELTKRILETARDTAVNLADMFIVLCDAGYGASYGKLEQGLREQRRARGEWTRQHQQDAQARRRYASMMYKLKRDGLLQEKEGFLRITEKGKATLAKLVRRTRKQLPSPKYEKHESNQLTLVIFDIPESEKRKRDWLRAVLKKLELTMIQKSVWAGKVKIPSRFLVDLRELRLTSFVEILQITKIGSIERLK